MAKNDKRNGAEGSIHLVHPEISRRVVPIKIALVGVGGTGSYLLNKLALIRVALEKLEYPGFHVFAFDPDIVTEANIGKQAFLPVDLYQNKAIAAVERINRIYGWRWDGIPDKFVLNSGIDIKMVISCVDTVISRKEIFSSIKTTNNENATQAFDVNYWLDCGNDKDYGQVILGTTHRTSFKQSEQLPKNHLNHLPCFHEEVGYWPEDNPNTPSCSLAESLTKQSLFINQIVADYTANLIFDLLTKPAIDYRGYYINFEQTRRINL